MGVGLAQGALDEAIAYAKERHAFGKPISKFQAIQMKLADIATEIEAARLLTCEAAIEKDAGTQVRHHGRAAKLKTGGWRCAPPRRRSRSTAAMATSRTTRCARFYRDAKILTIGEGTDEVQQMVIARCSRGC